MTRQFSLTALSPCKEQNIYGTILLNHEIIILLDLFFSAIHFWFEVCTSAFLM